MKRFTLAAALLLAAGAALAQTTTPKMVYTCPTETAVTKQAATTADCPAWSWQPPPAANANLPLVAFCTDCTWSRNTGQIKWKRPRETAAAELVAICTKNPALAAGSKANCSPESFVRSDTLLTTPTNPAPTAQFGIQPTTVPYLGTALFVWSSDNATSCKATGDWSSGDLSPSGSQYIGTMYLPTASYGLTCTGPGGSANAPPVTVTVTIPPPPSIAIRAAKNLIDVGQTVEIVWQSDNTTGCVSNWGEEINLSGASVRGPYSEPGFHEFRVKCTGVLRGTDVERTTGVNVVAPVAPIPLAPPRMPSQEEITRSLAGVGPVGWALLETPHPTWKIKVTFFTRIDDGRVVRYTYAMSWAELLGYADEVQRTGTYDQAAARNRCAATCVELAEDSPIDVELDAFKALPANSRAALGVIGE